MDQSDLLLPGHRSGCSNTALRPDKKRWPDNRKSLSTTEQKRLFAAMGPNDLLLFGHCCAYSATASFPGNGSSAAIFFPTVLTLFCRKTEKLPFVEMGHNDVDLSGHRLSCTTPGLRRAKKGRLFPWTKTTLNCPVIILVVLQQLCDRNKTGSSWMLPNMFH